MDETRWAGSGTSLELCAIVFEIMTSVRHYSCSALLSKQREYRYKEQTLWKQLHAYFSSRKYELLYSLIPINNEDGVSMWQRPLLPSSLTADEENDQRHYDQLEMIHWSIRDLQSFGVPLLRILNMCFILIATDDDDRSVQWLTSTALSSSFRFHMPLLINAKLIYHKCIQLYQTYLFDFFRRRQRMWFSFDHTLFFLTNLPQLNAYYFFHKYQLWTRLPCLMTYASRLQPLLTPSSSSSSSTHLSSHKRKRGSTHHSTTHTFPLRMKKKDDFLSRIFVFDCFDTPLIRAHPWAYYPSHQTNEIELTEAPSQLPNIYQLDPLPFVYQRLLKSIRLPNAFPFPMSKRLSCRHMRQSLASSSSTDNDSIMS
jgi:hypothetical protein